MTDDLDIYRYYPGSDPQYIKIKEYLGGTVKLDKLQNIGTPKISGIPAEEDLRDYDNYWYFYNDGNRELSIDNAYEVPDNELYNPCGGFMKTYDELHYKHSNNNAWFALRACSEVNRSNQNAGSLRVISSTFSESSNISNYPAVKFHPTEPVLAYIKALNTNNSSQTRHRIHVVEIGLNGNDSRTIGEIDLGYRKHGSNTNILHWSHDGKFLFFNKIDYSDIENPKVYFSKLAMEYSPLPVSMESKLVGFDTNLIEQIVRIDSNSGGYSRLYPSRSQDLLYGIHSNDGFIRQLDFDGNVKNSWEGTFINEFSISKNDNWIVMHNNGNDNDLLDLTTGNRIPIYLPNSGSESDHHAFKR